jgi:hypothetical protein
LTGRGGDRLRQYLASLRPAVKAGQERRLYLDQPRPYF